MRSRGRFEAGVLLIGVLVFLVQANADAAPNSLAEQGEGVFQQECAACHTIGGGDQPMGPDLAGVAARRQPEWLADFIRDPAKKIASGDPVAAALVERFQGLTMPTLELGDAKLEAVLAYLASPAEALHHAAPGEAPKPATAGEGAALVGDPARGAELYAGTIAFANGGAPCVACHGIGASALGNAASASYGPDLTALAKKYGKDGTASILKTLPFPSMRPIFANRPLTPQEQADLASFFLAVDARPAGRSGGSLVIHVVVTLAAFSALLGEMGRRRLRGVRQPLLRLVQEGEGARQ